MKNIAPTVALTKELQRLQRDLNSHRLLDYIPGDQSEAEANRKRERESKLARFHEILETLNTPATYPMVAGEGAPQYTFDIPAETQLALL